MDDERVVGVVYDTQAGKLCDALLPHWLPRGQHWHEQHNRHVHHQHSLAGRLGHRFQLQSYVPTHSRDIADDYAEVQHMNSHMVCSEPDLLHGHSTRVFQLPRAHAGADAGRQELLHVRERLRVVERRLEPVLHMQLEHCDVWRLVGAHLLLRWYSIHFDTRCLFISLATSGHIFQNTSAALVFSVQLIRHIAVERLHRQRRTQTLPLLSLFIYRMYVFCQF